MSAHIPYINEQKILTRVQISGIWSPLHDHPGKNHDQLINAGQWSENYGLQAKRIKNLLG